MQNRNISTYPHDVLGWMFCDLMQCNSNLTFWGPLYVENNTGKKKSTKDQLKI